MCYIGAPFVVNWTAFLFSFPLIGGSVVVTESYMGISVHSSLERFCMYCCRISMVLCLSVTQSPCLSTKFDALCIILLPLLSFVWLMLTLLKQNIFLFELFCFWYHYVCYCILLISFLPFFFYTWWLECNLLSKACFVCHVIFYGIVTIDNVYNSTSTFSLVSCFLYLLPSVFLHYTLWTVFSFLLFLMFSKAANPWVMIRI